MSAGKRKHRPQCIVVANEAAARVFVRGSDDDGYVEHRSLVNDSSRRKLSDIDTDRAGRSFDRHGAGRHAMDRESNSKTQSSRIFAKSVIGEVRDLLLRNKVRNYTVIAAPAFLGLLRGEVEKLSIAEPHLEIDKDLPVQTIDTALEALQRYYASQ